MDKIDRLSKVIDRLDDDEKGKLLKSARQLLRAQKALSEEPAAVKRNPGKKTAVYEIVDTAF
jgi:hypothetical protein